MLLISLPQSRVRYNCLYDGMGEKGQEKIERLICRRGNARLSVLQRCLVITYALEFRIARR